MHFCQISDPGDGQILWQAFVEDVPGPGKPAWHIPLPAFPVGYVFGSLHWRKDGRYLGFSMDSVRSPSDAYALDTQTLSVERWTYSEHGTINTDNFVEPKLIQWKSFDGLSISGFLYHPPAKFTGKRPVVIDMHGGPEDQFQPYRQGRDNYYMNELGIVVVHSNIRGSSGYGKTFLKLDNGLLREDSYKDIGALLDWIKTQPDLDADRVMVTGARYGGHMALAAAARYGGRIRCAIDIVGPANLVTFWNTQRIIGRTCAGSNTGMSTIRKCALSWKKLRRLTMPRKLRSLFS